MQKFTQDKHHQLWFIGTTAKTAHQDWTKVFFLELISKVETPLGAPKNNDNRTIMDSSNNNNDPL